MSKHKSYDYLFKIVFAGSSCAGKSSIIKRFTEYSFDEIHLSTVGIDFRLKTIICNDKTIKLQIWDTAGQERFRTIISSYYRGAHAIVIVYDVTDRESFASINYWIAEVKKYTDDDIPILLIGNKIDLDTSNYQTRKITEIEAKKYANSHRCMFVETSAKDNTNIDECFTKIVSTLIDKQISDNSDSDYIYNPFVLSKTEVINQSCKDINECSC